MFEENYYINDILTVMEKHNANEAERMLSELNLFTFDHMEQNGRERFVDGLKKAAGLYEDAANNNSLDKGGLDMLRGKFSKK